MSFKFRAIIFDMDGVVYRGHTAIEGVPKTISSLRSRNVNLFFLTNNASRSRNTLAKRLKKMGIYTRKSEIITSAQAAALHISSIHPHAKVFALGERGMKDELRMAGLRLVGADGKPEFFVNGLDRHLTYRKLSDSLHVLKNGARWVACNSDPTYPIENGKENPGAGSIAAALICASGRKPEIVLGKPNKKILAPILSKLLGKGILPNEIALVGDRLEIDVALANSAGIISILVLTGVASAHSAKNAKGKNKPKIILRSAAEITKLLS